MYACKSYYKSKEIYGLNKKLQKEVFPICPKITRNFQPLKNFDQAPKGMVKMFEHL